MLRLESVTKNYNHRNKKITGLHELNLEIGGSEFLSVVGPSGSGKSTLLNILGGMLAPSDGRVIIDEESIYDLSTDARAIVRRSKIGFLFQTFNLVPYLSALENVEIPMFLAGKNSDKHKNIATGLLDRLGLADRMDHKPSELSVGQQQRVALARMLANDPTLILADEPTGNLDPETSREIIDFLLEINHEGKTIVMVTHNPEAARKADRILNLVDGKIQNEIRGSTGEL